jgi:hypothetical protein
MFLKNDGLYWIGMFLAIPLYLLMTFLVLCFIWVVGRPRRSNEEGDESTQDRKQTSLIGDIAWFYGTKGLGILMAGLLCMLFTAPSEDDTILYFIPVLLIFCAFITIFFFGGGFSFAQYRSGQYKGLNWYFQWAFVVGPMLFVLGYFFGLIEVYLLKVLVLFSEINILGL